MDKPNYYAIIPANVRYDKNLKPNAKLLYAEITSLTNDKGYCWATNKYFADLYDVSKETISRWISDLIKNGYITSNVIYGDDKKTIIQRRLYLSEINSYCQNNHDPIDENVNDPIDKKIKDNNKYINNKININDTIDFKSGNIVTEQLPKRYTETEIEKDKDKEKEKIKKHKYGEFKNVLLSDPEYEKLKNDYGSNFDKLLKTFDEGIEMKGYKYKNHNLAMRNWANRDGIKTEEEKKDEFKNEWIGWEVL